MSDTFLKIEIVLWVLLGIFFLCFTIHNILTIDNMWIEKWECIEWKIFTYYDCIGTECIVEPWMTEPYDCNCNYDNPHEMKSCVKYKWVKVIQNE